MVLNCLHHKAARYLMDYCIPASDVTSRRHLRSSRRQYLVVPRYSPSSYGRRAFAVAGPTASNSLNDDLRDPTLSTDSFRRLLKTWLFSEYFIIHDLLTYILICSLAPLPLTNKPYHPPSPKTGILFDMWTGVLYIYAVHILRPTYLWRGSTVYSNSLTATCRGSNTIVPRGTK